MFRKLGILATTILACLGITLIAAPSAQAYHAQYTVDNRVLSTQFYARCVVGQNPGYTTEIVLDYYENTGAADCSSFSVGDTRQVQYKSLASGATYWSACGRDLSHAGTVSSGYGMQPIGNDVLLLAKRAC